MLKISKKTWVTLIILSLLSIFIWQKYTAPQLSFIDLSISRQQAKEIASQYLLKERAIASKDLNS